MTQEAKGNDVLTLLPCPFCGDRPKLSGSVIGCTNKDCWGPSIWHMANQLDSIVAWNRRNDGASGVVKAEDRLAELDEISDGAWGDNPMIRGRARDEAQRIRAEEIAKIIDPHTFLPLDLIDGDEWSAEMVQQGRDLALSKARRILSALAAPIQPVTNGWVMVPQAILDRWLDGYPFNDDSEEDCALFDQYRASKREPLPSAPGATS